MAADGNGGGPPRGLRAAAAAVPAPVLVLGSIVSVQVGAAVAKTMFDELGHSGVVVLRLGLAALLLAALVRPAVRHWERRQWGAAAVLGLALAAMNGVFYAALDTTPLGVAVTVEFVGPLLLALAQTRRLRDLVWALLAMAGVALLGLERGGADVPLTGLLLALLAGGFWAGYILASARVGRLVPGIDGLVVALAVGAVAVLPFGATGAAGAFADPWLLLGGLGVAVLSSIVPYGLELVALRRLPTRVFGILMSLEPAAAASAGFLVLRQALSVRQLLALVLVSVASAGVTLGRRDGLPVEPGPGKLAP